MMSRPSARNTPNGVTSRAVSVFAVISLRFPAEDVIARTAWRFAPRLSGPCHLFGPPFDPQRAYRAFKLELSADGEHGSMSFSFGPK